jgi:hypothetical protein
MYKQLTILDLVLVTIAGNIVPGIFATFAGLLAMHQIWGWGWFLFAAVITVSLPRTKNEI